MKHLAFSARTTLTALAACLSWVSMTTPAHAQACAPKALAAETVKAPVEGQIVQAFGCKDAEGDQVFIETRMPGGVVAGKRQPTALSFYQFTMGPNGTATRRWQARDFIPADLRPAKAPRNARFVVRDIDGDGAAESFISYALPGVSSNPDEGKLLVFYKDRKFAIRGAVAAASNDFSTRNLDATFNALPPAVQSYALGLWDSVALPRGFNPGGGITVTQAPEH
jgi:hypothetical protein